LAAQIAIRNDEAATAMKVTSHASLTPWRIDEVCSSGAGSLFVRSESDAILELLSGPAEC